MDCKFGTIFSDLVGPAPSNFEAHISSFECDGRRLP